MCSSDLLSRRFQRFSQADSSTTRRFGGSGLGLALTRAFVEMLGGSIDVTSEAGRGTCFRITMPLDVAPAPEALVPEADAGLPGGEAPLVLVIDDDPATRDLLGRFLRREGFAVRLASDGRAGLELARRLRPATILLAEFDRHGRQIAAELNGAPPTSEAAIQVEIPAAR